MANKTINELTAVTVVTNLDEVEVQKSGETTTKKATVTQITNNEALARAAQDDIIETGVGLTTLGTYPSLTGSRYLRAADFLAGITDRDGASGALTENVINALRILDVTIYDVSSSISGSILTMEIPCTIADILSCNASPKVLLPNAAGKYYEIISAVGYNMFNNTSYEAGTSKLEIKYSGGSIISELDNAFLEAGTDVVYRAIPTTNGAMTVNSSVVLYCATPPTGGDGAITISLTYRVHEP